MNVKHAKRFKGSFDICLFVCIMDIVDHVLVHYWESDSGYVPQSVARSLRH